MDSKKAINQFSDLAEATWIFGYSLSPANHMRKIEKEMSIPVPTAPDASQAQVYIERMQGLKLALLQRKQKSLGRRIALIPLWVDAALVVLGLVLMGFGILLSTHPTSDLAVLVSVVRDALFTEMV